MARDKGEIDLDYTGKLKGATFAFAGMNFMIDPANLPIEEGQCVDICNCDVDYKNNVSRRNGYTMIAQGDYANGWSNGTDTYATINGTLVYLILNENGASVSVINGVPTLYGKVEFKQVNNVVFFSDSIICGILESNYATMLGEPIFGI